MDMAIFAEAPAGIRFARIVALVNPRSGSAGPDAVDIVRSRCAALGIAVDARTIEQDWTGAVRAAASSEPDAIAVLGGDGTARCAAEALGPTGPPLMLLPGGTMNVLPRALLGDFAWPEALERAVRLGVVADLYGAEADRKAFFVAAIFGSPALAQPAREAVRAGRLDVAAVRVRRALARAFRVKISARTRYKSFRRAEAVAVLAPAIAAIDDERLLEIAAVRASSLTESARIGMRALFGDWRADPAAELTGADAVDLISLRPIPALLDGEVERFDRRVHVRLRPAPVRVVRLPDGSIGGA